MTIWEAFKAGFGFLSVIPVGITMEGIDALMKRLYMYPIVGFLLGIFIGGIAFIAEMFLPTPLTIISIILAVYSIIWFNHLDGVADMGDGMTAHGSLEKKRKALKDMSLGIGGVAFAVLLILAFYSSLYALENAAEYSIRTKLALFRIFCIHSANDFIIRNFRSIRPFFNDGFHYGNHCNHRRNLRKTSHADDCNFRKIIPRRTRINDDCRRNAPKFHNRNDIYGTGFIHTFGIGRNHRFNCINTCRFHYIENQQPPF